MTDDKLKIFKSKWKKYLKDIERNSMSESASYYEDLYQECLDFSIYKLQNPKYQKEYLSNHYLTTNHKMVDLSHMLFKLINEERFEDCIIIDSLMDQLDVLSSIK
jgi:hypothetical protein